MSTPGHCRHCDKRCSGRKDFSHFAKPFFQSGLWDVRAWWPDTNCPACDTAQLIADAIAQAAGPPDDGTSRGPIGDAILDTYMDAWAIARKEIG